MSSSRVLRNHKELPKFTASLKAVERVDLHEEQRLKTEDEVATLRDAGYQEGHAIGYRDGYTQGEAQGLSAGNERGYDEAKAAFEEEHKDVLSNLQASLEALLADFHVAVENWFTEAENQYADIAIEVAKRAVSAELKLNHLAVLTIAHDVLQHVRSGQAVRVRVNPADVSILEGHRQELMNSLAGIGGIEVVADRSIEAGVVIETSEGMVDARVETFVDRFEAVEAA